MDTEVLNSILLFLLGLIAGAINTLAGGGSLLILPVLIFMGLPSAIANGTNRVAILSQNALGIYGFQSKGITTFRYGVWLSLATLIGAIPGTIWAVKIDEDLFNKLLAVIMIVVMAVLFLDPFKGKEALPEKMSTKRLITSIVIFFFIGMYIGFIQAGAGFLIIATLTFVNRFDLLRTNSVKLWVNLTATVVSLSVFVYQDLINWPYGISLAVGSGIGAWATSRWAATKGQKWIRPVLVVMIFLMALKLLGVGEWLRGLF